MQLYLTGPPVSTRKSPYGVDVGPQTRESVQLALFERARQLHLAAPEGLSPLASKLKLERTVSQLRKVTSGDTVILCWVWLSDGSTFRCAWLSESAENRLYRSWQRIPWSTLVFRTGGKPGATSRPQNGKVARG